MNPFLVGCFVLSFTSALLAFFFSTAVTVGLVATLLVLAGVACSMHSDQLLQGYLMLVGFGALLVVGAIALGVVAGQQLRARRFILGILLLAPAPCLLWYDHAARTGTEEATAMALDYVTHHAQLRTLVDGPLEAGVNTSQARSGSGDGIYSVGIRGTDFVAVVDVARTGGDRHARLACVTTTAHVHDDDKCERHALALPIKKTTPSGG